MVICTFPVFKVSDVHSWGYGYRRNGLRVA